LVYENKLYADMGRIVDAEDKPKLLLKVFQALLDKLEVVRGADSRKDFEKRYGELSRISTILSILDGSLDMSYGELPRNLSNLYGYLIGQIGTLHSAFNETTLDACKDIITKIYEGFSEAYEVEKKKAREPSVEPAQRRTITA
jgi:flagellar secretion chaperone FliS